MRRDNYSKIKSKKSKFKKISLVIAVLTFDFLNFPARPAGGDFLLG